MTFWFYSIYLLTLLTSTAQLLLCSLKHCNQLEPPWKSGPSRLKAKSFSFYLIAGPETDVLWPNIEEPLVNCCLDIFTCSRSFLSGTEGRQPLFSLSLNASLVLQYRTQHASLDDAGCDNIGLLFSAFDSDDYLQLWREGLALPFYGSHHNKTVDKHSKAIRWNNTQSNKLVDVWCNREGAPCDNLVTK